MLDIDAFLTELSSEAPVPGGGSVAALEVSMGAALLAMVANLTVGRKRYEQVQDAALRIREMALKLQRDARSLADEDAKAYGAVSRAMSLPRATEEEKRSRAEQIQAALKLAVTPPLQTLRAAGSVAQLAAELIEIGNRSAVSDVGTAIVSARAGYYAALLNVDINLQSIRDAEWVRVIRQEITSVGSPDALERKVMERTNQIIRGGAG